MVGVAVAVKSQFADVRVYGFQSEGADSMVRSLEAGRIVALDSVSTCADGLAARAPGEWTYPLARRWLDGVLRVTEADLMAAMRMLLEEERLLVEPAGAAGLAGLLQYGADAFGRNICLLITGGNISDAMLAQVLAR